mgnify:CR=1 FL=1
MLLCDNKGAVVENAGVDVNLPREASQCVGWALELESRQGCVHNRNIDAHLAAETKFIDESCSCEVGNVLIEQAGVQRVAQVPVPHVAHGNNVRP